MNYRAEVAQWQSTAFIRRLLWVRSPPLAPILSTIEINPFKCYILVDEYSYYRIWERGENPPYFS